MARTVAEIWEGFARRDPAFYILARHLSADGVIEAGRRDARRMMRALSPHLEARRVAVDVGCGLGRLAIPLADEFERVVAVDVAPTMLRQLERECSTRGVTNVTSQLASDEWDRGDADLAVSCLTLQHVDDPDAARCVERMATALRPGGVAWIQVDSRRRSPLYALRNRMPDLLLPTLWRRGIRRIRRPASSYAALFERNDLAVVAERNAETAHHVFVLRRHR